MLKATHGDSLLGIHRLESPVSLSTPLNATVLLTPYICVLLPGVNETTATAESFYNIIFLRANVFRAKKKLEKYLICKMRRVPYLPYPWGKWVYVKLCLCQVSKFSRVWTKNKASNLGSLDLGGGRWSEMYLQTYVMLTH